jgi:Protein of unknown function (DUF1501)
MPTTPFFRRDLIFGTLNGFGALALHQLMSSETTRASESSGMLSGLLPKRKAKNCIFLFMAGGVSQMDSFEYKPVLNALHGKPIPRVPPITIGELQGKLSFPHVCVGSPFRFQQYGASGRYISELLPNLAKHVDDLAFIHGIEVDNQNHGPATLHVNTGSPFPGSPSVGAWIQYGLGSVNENLPGYVVIQDPRGAPTNGAAVWGNGYLPAAHQGTLLRTSGTPIIDLARPLGVSSEQQRLEFDAIKWLNQRQLSEGSANSELEARIAAYEMAFRLQTAAPELVDLEDETAQTKALYGLDNPQTANFGRQCLLARRMVERGVRHTLLVHGVEIGPHSWDDHSDVRSGMIRHCAEVDLPVAGLLADLKQRGLLEDTLVVWSSEMGRSPILNGKLGNKPGRDHNGYALCMWMAGGGVKGGSTVGQTDEFSLRSIDDGIHIRDVHATLLNLMGLDDNELTWLHAGRLRKLTDIGGRILEEIIA